jgi:hypothetical protein
MANKVVELLPAVRPVVATFTEIGSPCRVEHGAVVRWQSFNNPPCSHILRDNLVGRERHPHPGQCKKHVTLITLQPANERAMQVFR